MGGLFPAVRMVEKRAAPTFSLFALVSLLLLCAPLGWASPLDESDTPSNDAFATAIAIDAYPFTDQKDTATATRESDEPTPCAGIGATVWYTLTLAEERLVVADTFDSDYDTVLAAHTGSSLIDLTEVACNDDRSSLQSRISFLALPGTTYFLQVGGYFEATGDLQLHVTTLAPGAVANDDFADALPITAFPFADVRDTTGATLEPDEPEGCDWNGATVWYTFTPEETTLITLHTWDSDFYTNVVAYSRTSLGDLELVGCADTYLEFSAEANVTYYLQVGGWDGDFGLLDLQVAGLPGEPWVETTVWEGHLDCSVGTGIGVALSACSLTPSSTDSFLMYDVLDPGIRTLVTRLEWEPASPGGEELRLLVETRDGRALRDVRGPSPLDARLDGLPLEGLDIRFRVFAHGSPAGVAVQQPFTLTYDEHYFQAAPWDEAVSWF